MNLDIIDFVFKLPPMIVTRNEKQLLLAVGASIPTLDKYEETLSIVPALKGTFARRKGRASLISEYMKGREKECIYRIKPGNPFFSAWGVMVDEGNEIMRINDYLQREENLTIKVLARKMSLSESAVRSAKMSLIKKGFLKFEIRDNKQYWQIQLAELDKALREAKKASPTSKHYPKRARPNTVQSNKRRAEEAQIADLIFNL